MHYFCTDRDKIATLRRIYSELVGAYRIDYEEKRRWTTFCPHGNDFDNLI